VEKHNVNQNSELGGVGRGTLPKEHAEINAESLLSSRQESCNRSTLLLQYMLCFLLILMSSSVDRQMKSKCVSVWHLLLQCTPL